MGFLFILKIEFEIHQGIGVPRLRFPRLHTIWYHYYALTPQPRHMYFKYGRGNGEMKYKYLFSAQSELPLSEFQPSVKLLFAL